MDPFNPEDHSRYRGLHQTRGGSDDGVTEARTSYKLPSRQAGIPSWFIAREHRFTTGTAWSRGVLLTHRGHPAPATALLLDDGQAQTTIDLRVRGHAPHAFYSILNEGFTGILADRYPGLVVQQKVPCTCTAPPEPPCGYEFDYAFVQLAVERGQDMQCQKTGLMVDPRILQLGLTPSTKNLTLTDIAAKIDVLDATVRGIQEQGLTVLDTVRDLLRYRGEQGAHCPSIFIVMKTGRLGRYELRLFCEQPEAPHPLPDGAGTYPLQKIPDWLRRYAPFLKVVVGALRYTVPLVGPALAGIAEVSLPEVDKERLKLAEQLLDDVASLPNDRTGGDLPVDYRPGQPGRANFNELRQALIGLDPDMEWGGLRERQRPETGQIHYLCPIHREALHYPAQPPDRRI